MNHNLSFGVLLLKFWLHVIGKIQDGSNADVAVNQYHSKRSKYQLQHEKSTL